MAIFLRQHRRRRCAPRYRRLFVEGLEVRQLLAAAPSGTDRTVSTPEEIYYAFKAADFGFADPLDTPPNSFLGIKIVSLPASGRLANSFVTVKVGEFIAAPVFGYGGFRYNPPLDGFGNSLATFTFQVQDNGGTAAGGEDLDPTPNTITINVTPVNDPPEGAFRTLTVLQGTSRTLTEADFPFFDPLDNPPNALKSIDNYSAPSVGALTFNGSPLQDWSPIPMADIRAGKLAYSAPPQGAQPTQFQYRLQDDGGTANFGRDEPYTLEIVTLVVTAQPNTPPSGFDRTIGLLQNTNYAFSAADFTFTDLGGIVPNNPLAVKIAAPPFSGTLTASGIQVVAGQTISAADIAAGKLVFVPAAGASGAALAAFTFQVQDDGGTAGGGFDLDPSPNTLTINVKPINQPPTATNDTYATNQNELLAVAAAGGLGKGVLVNDTDADDPRAEARLVAGPAHGRLALLADGSFTYMPTRRFTGADSFTYRADDRAVQANLSQVATVTITVTPLNHAPVARDDRFFDSTKLTNNLKPNGVVNNDSDLDEDELTATLVSSAAHGAVSLAPTGIFTYTPVAGYTGPDSFTYQLSDGALLSNVATVSLNIPAANAAPADEIIVRSEYYTTGVNTPLALDFPGLLANDYSTHGNTIWIPFASVADYDTQAALTLENSGRIVFTPPLNFTGQKSIQYHVQDGEGAYSRDGWAGIRVKAAGNQRPIAGDDSYATRPNKSLVITPSVLANDVDPDGDTLRIVVATQPGHGALSLSPGGDLIYTPTGSYSGTDSFTYKARDGQLESNLATVTVTIAGTSPSHAPSGADKTVTLLERANHVFAAGAFGFSDANDTPADVLAAVKITTLPTAGTLTFNNVAVTAGQLIPLTGIESYKLKFTPATGGFGFPYASFTFQVQDDGGTAGGGVDLDPTPRSFTFNVQQVVDPPSGSDLTVGMQEDHAYTIGVADFGFYDSQDTPPNNFAFVRITTLPWSGSLLLNGVHVVPGMLISVSQLAAGLLWFVPYPNNWNGSYLASFTFQVQDDGGPQQWGQNVDPTPNTMTFNVLPVNDAPLGWSKSITLPGDASYTFSAVDWGFSDPNDLGQGPYNSLMAVKITTLPTAGTLTSGTSSVAAGDFVPLANILSGALQFQPGPDAAGTPYSSFTFQVQDNGGTANGGRDLDYTPKTITINVVGGVSRPPSGLDHTVTSAAEDAPYAFALSDFPFTDSDNHALFAVRIATLPVVGSLTLTGGAIAAPVVVGQLVSAVDIASGYLRFLGNAHASGSAYASFAFQVKDNGGTAMVAGVSGIDLDPSPSTQTINVLPVNDAPRGADKLVVTLEDVGFNFAASDFGFSDPFDQPPNQPAGPHTLQGLVIGPQNLQGGTLRLSGVDVAIGQLISVGQIGGLVFTPGQNHNDGNSTRPQFVFQVRDNGGIFNGGIDMDQTPDSLTVSITPVNDAPRGMDRSIAVSPCNVPITFSLSDFGYSDPLDSPANSLLAIKVTSLSTTGPLVLAGTAVVTGQLISAADIAAGKLSFTPASAGQADSLSFQVQDDGGTANGGRDLAMSANLISFFRGGLPGAPARNIDQTMFAREDVPYTFRMSDFPLTDLDGDTLNGFTIVSLPGNGSLQNNGVPVTVGQFISTLDIAQGRLVYASPANHNGQPYSQFGFEVADGQGVCGGPSSGTMTVNVLPVNDPPSFLIGADLNVTDESGPQSIAGWAQAIIAGPLDEALQKLTFHIVVDRPQLLAAGPIVDASGRLTFTPARNAVGIARVSVFLADDGGTAIGGSDASATQSFLIQVKKLHPQHNAVAALDVDGNTFVSPGDALASINYLNTPGFSSEVVGPGAEPPYFDVNGDGFISPQDVLAVINHLNAFGAGPAPEGESRGEAAEPAFTTERTAAPKGSAAANMSDLIALLALDPGQPSTRPAPRRA